MKTDAIRVRRVAHDNGAHRRVVEAVNAAPNGELGDLSKTVAAFEQKFRMSSADALARVSRGEMAATREIETWLTAVQVRDDLATIKR